MVPFRGVCTPEVSKGAAAGGPTAADDSGGEYGDEGPNDPEE